MRYLILLPVLLAALSAIFHKMRRARYVEAGLLMVILTTIIVNALVISEIYGNSFVELWLYYFQASLSCFIVPSCYLYFSYQTGRYWLNSTSVALFLLILLMLVPNICIDLSYVGSGGGTYDIIYPHCICFFKNGLNVLHFGIESLIIMLQTLLVLRRLLVYRSQMIRYELRYTKSMKLFFAWSCICALLAIVYHLFPQSYWAGNPFIWIYFIAYVLLCSAGFAGIALKMDLHPIITAEDKQQVQMENFISANARLATRMRHIFEETDICTRQGLVIDDVVAMLGTNRTYFTRMMRAEFGMSFTEYVHFIRLEKCKKALMESDASLEDIAMDTGFGTASNMSRVFKKMTGETPDAWRHASGSCKNK